VTTYFPAVTRRSEAQHIIVRPGADLDGFEMRLPAVPVHRVRGTVLDETGKPGARATVRLYAPDYWSGAWEARVTTAEDGAFEFPAVSERDWQITAGLERDKIPLSGFVELIVSRHDVEGLQIRLAAPLTVKAIMKWKDAPPAARKAYVRLRPESDIPARTAYGAQQDDGTIQIEGVYPGRYRLEEFNLRGGYYLTSVFWGGRETFGQPLDILDASLPLELTFEKIAGSIRGTIENCAGATIALWGLREPAIETEFFRQTTCDAAGHFEFSDLRPGPYTVAAFSFVADRYQLQDPAFARLMAKQALQVQVEKGSAVSVEIKPMAWPE
jgi:hypothetical protein